MGRGEEGEKRIGDTEKGGAREKREEREEGVERERKRDQGIQIYKHKYINTYICKLSTHEITHRYP